MQKEDCLFCSLQSSSNQVIIYQDDTCYVVPDKFPSANGHLLVITKAHYKDMLSAPEDIVSHTFTIARKMGLLAMERLNASGINIATNIGKSAGQIIMHMHVHVLPRYDSGAPSFDFGKGKELSTQQAAELARKLSTSG